MDLQGVLSLDPTPNLSVFRMFLSVIFFRLQGKGIKHKYYGQQGTVYITSVCRERITFLRIYVAFA